MLWKANFTLRGVGLRLISRIEAKFRDGLLGINIVLLISKKDGSKQGKVGKGGQKQIS